MKPRKKSLKEEISLLENKIEELKNSCNHRNRIQNYTSNTGNLDPNDDVYWKNIKCLDCGKAISVSSNNKCYNMDKIDKKTFNKIYNGF